MPDNYFQVPLPAPWPGAVLRVAVETGFYRAQWNDAVGAWLRDCSEYPHWVGKAGEENPGGWTLAPASSPMPPTEDC